MRLLKIHISRRTLFYPAITAHDLLCFGIELFNDMLLPEIVAAR